MRLNRCFLLVCINLMLCLAWANQCNNSTPNIIIMLMDDMGWGDLGVNGDPSRETVNLDNMAREGLVFTDFYAGNPLCSPSRAALLTGRLPIRNGFFTTNIKARNSYVPQNMVGGISKEEVLLPEILSKVGYRNKIVGKWHLGHSKQEFMPLSRGFHEFFGSPNVHFGPYNDKKLPNVPVFRNDKMIGRFYENIVINHTTHISNFTQWATQEAIDFIQAQSNSSKPFFLYWTPDSLHAPTFRSKEFAGKSIKNSSYGDALIEIDHSIGKIMDVIRNDECLSNNTFVFFTSDNGPAFVDFNDCGSAGLFLCGKQTTYEGGVREPAIAWWPGKIKPHRTTHQIATVMDLFRTVASLTGAKVPTDRIYDSNDLSGVMFEDKTIDNATMFYYRGDTLMAIRHGPYKAHYWTFTNPIEEFLTGVNYCPGSYLRNFITNDLVSHEQNPIVFHLERDPGERFPIPQDSKTYKEVKTHLFQLKEKHNKEMKRGKPVLNYCDDAAMNWSPPGCKELNMCLPAPPSKQYLCHWPH